MNSKLLRMISIGFFLFKTCPFHRKHILHFGNRCVVSKVVYSTRKESPNSNSNKNWVSIDILNEKERLDRDMMSRIRDAASWESKALSNDEAKSLNRLLGIEREVLDYETETKKQPNRRKNVENSSYPTVEKSEIKGFLEINPFVCSGCGTAFQYKSTNEPGFLPKEKFQLHRNKAEFIRQQQEAIKILEFAGIDINSAAAEEVLRDGNVPSNVIDGIKKIGKIRENKVDIKVSNDVVESDDKETESEISDHDSLCICQRCFRLQQYGQVEESLRPGWSDHELLTPQRFETLLSSIKESKTIVTCIVDIFDLQGSILKNLKKISGDNPIVIAVNKIDLLPKDISQTRIIDWIHAELQKVCGLRSPREVQEEKRQVIIDQGWIRPKTLDSEEGILRRANIHLVSCHSGLGMEKLVDNLMAMAKDHGEKVHIMGAANVGKSSFINYLLDTKNRNRKLLSQKRKSNDIPKVTVSNLPGTTLDFLKVKLPNGVTMIDTPGLINPNQLTARLTTNELKKVIPIKPINAVTLRIAEGKCVMIGGLAIIKLLEGRPFFLTFFISNEVKLHPTDVNRVEEILSNHVGTLIDPPSSIERLHELGPKDEHIFMITGDGWGKSSTDIVIAGLGWVTITGVGSCRISVKTPKDIEVGVREALLPYEAKHTTAKFTGGRLTKSSKKPGDHKPYGWRA